jgi:hypothetical protein
VVRFGLAEPALSEFESVHLVIVGFAVGCVENFQDTSDDFGTDS